MLCTANAVSSFLGSTYSRHSGHEKRLLESRCVWRCHCKPPFENVWPQGAHVCASNMGSSVMEQHSSSGHSGAGGAGGAGDAGGAGGLLVNT